MDLFENAGDIFLGIFLDSNFSNALAEHLSMRFDFGRSRVLEFEVLDYVFRAISALHILTALVIGAAQEDSFVRWLVAVLEAFVALAAVSPVVLLISSPSPVRKVDEAHNRPWISAVLAD